MLGTILFRAAESFTFESVLIFSSGEAFAQNGTDHPQVSQAWDFISAAVESKSTSSHL